MFTSFTVLLASAVVASAASSSSASASAAAATPSAAASNPYIPSGISSACSSYLATLNDDTTLTACTSALISATSAFGPSSSSSTTESKSSITTALDTICATSISTSCPQSLLTGKLASFQTACSVELTSDPDTQVKTIYDTFYGLFPLLSAVCTKDDSGNYCATESNATGLASAAIASGVTSAASSIARRGVTTAYLPNATAINTDNIMFLGLSGTASKAALCTTCTRNILTAYISFEADTVYAPGLPQSVLLSGQSTLYSGVVSTCGSAFLTSTVQAAGGLGTSGTGGASSGAGALRAGTGLATLAGAAALALVL